MLVAHRGARCRVAEPAHEFGEGGAGLGSQDSARVAQVVESQVRPRPAFTLAWWYCQPNARGWMWCPVDDANSIAA